MAKIKTRNSIELFKQIDAQQSKELANTKTPFGSGMVRDDDPRIREIIEGLQEAKAGGFISAAGFGFVTENGAKNILKAIGENMSPFMV